MAKEKINFLQIRKGKAPKRAYEFDAGIDFFVPEFTAKFVEDLINANPLTFKCFIDPVNSKFGSAKNQNPVAKKLLTLGYSIPLDELSGKSQPQDFFGYDIEEGNPYFILVPGEGVKIPAGIKSRMASPGRALIAANKSGIATRDKLTYGAQVIDYTYKGEIHLHLINNSNNKVKIYQNQKIIQFLETPIFNSEVNVISRKSINDELNFFEGLEDDRGSGGFGSTDKK